MTAGTVAQLRPPPAAEPAVCRCGHERPGHTHFRRGTDCALCDCGRWAPKRWWMPWR